MYRRISTARSAPHWIEPLLAAIAETIPLLVSGAPDAFMSEVARRFTPPKEEPAEEPAQS